MGVYIDSHLNGKIHIDYVSKIKRIIGLLSKLRYFVSRKVLNNLYYALLYPFFISGLVTWGNTYETTILPLFILQKKLVRTMTFSKFDNHLPHYSNDYISSSYLILFQFKLQYSCINFIIVFYHVFLIPFLLMLIKFINIIHDLLLINHTTFTELELIMAFSTSDSRGPQYGML